ncbi:hypothetical protein [Actinomadura hibisca]|uniref:hypothetical protein n=1 Tax=Actinomadura hibisca TaxID=68565 RepID=UPI000834AF81|nr:hypothetical protein [Actinomadura hibisca]
MTNPDRSPAALRLAAALDGLAMTFRGMTANPDETACECHFGSVADLALLKTPDVELDPDLLRRTWQASWWDDHASVLRRVLPQFATALVGGLIEPWSDFVDVGRFLVRGNWRQWPTDQAAAVQEFLDAWWLYTLTAPSPEVPAYETFVGVVEASGSLTPWLATWETVRTPAADQHLAQAIERWEYDLLGGVLPWNPWLTSEEEDDRRYAELTSWIARHAPDRLRRHGASERLLHGVRLIGLTGPDRWEDPHWPGYRY